MTSYQRDTLFTALFAASVLVTLNIIAVTTGVADSYYADIQHWIEAVLG